MEVHFEVQSSGETWCEEVDERCTVAILISLCEAHLGTARGAVTIAVAGTILFDHTVLLADTPYAGEPIVVDYRPFFEVGHLIEARDRKHHTNITLAHITKVLGRTISIALEGWSETYSYTTEDDTLDIAPVGACSSLGLRLSPPRGSVLSAEEYIAEFNQTPAPIECFAGGEYFTNGARKTVKGRVLDAHCLPETAIDDVPNDLEGTTKFEVGMHLEARDRKHPRMIAVAHVVAVHHRRVRISFDGWADHYDYWAHDTSPDLAQCGTCYVQKRGFTLPRRVSADAFVNWDSYLAKHESVAAPVDCFRTTATPLSGHAKVEAGGDRTHAKYSKYVKGGGGGGGKGGGGGGEKSDDSSSSGVCSLQ